MPESYRLIADEECGTCDLILPGFRTLKNNSLFISGENFAKESVIEAVHSVIKSCPSGAISIVPSATEYHSSSGSVSTNGA